MLREMSVAAALVPAPWPDPLLRSVPDERADAVAALHDAEEELDRIAVLVAQGDLARRQKDQERAAAFYRTAAAALHAFEQ